MIVSGNNDNHIGFFGDFFSLPGIGISPLVGAVFLSFESPVEYP
jgi:hypothetical protein